MASLTVSRFGIFLCVIMLVGCISASMSRPPRNNDINNMADALKYLQDLDNYYGDKARVRFGKRTSLLLRDRLMDDQDLVKLSKLLAQRDYFKTYFPLQ